MITIFLRLGKPTDWAVHRLEVDESNTISSIEGPLPVLRHPKLNWGIGNLNDWCMNKPYRHIRFSFDGFYRRSLRHWETSQAHAHSKGSLIRQFWITETGTRLMSVHPPHEDVLAMPTPLNLKMGTVRDGLPHPIARLCLPDDIPMNTLGELGRTQM